RMVANQQATTSQWVTLGTWSFSAGWNKVVLSRWADAGKVVIADAVRVR
ncbi:MAG: cwhA, partial [Deltaproteobacteria bacterium]|nr:cwhA [Deltaproteobacteria bacterium]